MILKVKMDANYYDITKAVISFTWEGSAKQAARTLTFSMAYSPNDKSVPTLNIKLGHIMLLYDDDKKLIFYGEVTNRERHGEAGSLEYTAQDNMIHLLRSNGTYKFTNKTPEQIAKLICKDAQVSIGNLAETKVAIDKIFFQDRPYYEIIMAGYTKAFRKNKKPYIAQMRAQKLDVIEKGTMIEDNGYYLNIREGEKITESSYVESLDPVVNRVVVYNESNQKVGEVKSNDSIKEYGIFQSTASDLNEAKSLIAYKSKEASLSAIGDTRCISGYGIYITDKRARLKGKYWIENDSHTWENGSYMMSLELAFKNVMDIQEEDQEEQAESGNSSSTTVSSGGSDAMNDVLNEARSLIGTAEEPPGSNHNSITEYYGEGDLQWCCAFIWTIFNKSGHGDLFIGGGKTAYCFDVRDYYSARGKFGSTPKVGALIIYGGAGHIGIVESVNGSSYVTIEGNYGDMVQRRNGPGQSQTVLGFCYVDYPVNTGTVTSSGSYTKYNLSNDDLELLALLGQREQGSVEGAKAELSLLANQYESSHYKNAFADKIQRQCTSIVDYAQNSGWFGHSVYRSALIADAGSLQSDIKQAAIDVLINGNRTLPTKIDEHDCVNPPDIRYGTNNGVQINLYDKSQYIPNVTKLYNVYGSYYTFYCFPASDSDPFGYTGQI